MTVAETRNEHLRHCDDNSIGHDEAQCARPKEKPHAERADKRRRAPIEWSE